MSDEAVMKPIDLDQCQRMFRKGSFMSLGKPYEWQCKEPPAYIAFERHPRDDGTQGAMSICEDCAKFYRESGMVESNGPLYPVKQRDKEAK